MLPIKGIQKTTLVDFPGRIASTVFLGGCNFRCPFCHNVTLVKDPQNYPDIDEKELLDFLSTRTKNIEGVCITGGEPTLFDELPDFIARVKSLGYAIKLDTNGTRPEMIQKLIDQDLVDYIAMDIKAPESLYNEASGVQVDMSAIKKSIGILKNCAVDYEFRTTVVPQFFPKEKTNEIIKLIGGSQNYYLQQFENSVEVLDHKLQEQATYSKQDLEELADKFKDSFQKVKTKGAL